MPQDSEIIEIEVRACQRFDDISLHRRSTTRRRASRTSIVVF
jgi:hypothetical protein